MNGGGAVRLTKVGAGTLTLSGADTYTGGAHIKGGVLEVTWTGKFGKRYRLLRSTSVDFSNAASLPRTFCVVYDAGNESRRRDFATTE